MLHPDHLGLLGCPSCRGSLDLSPGSEALHCARCGRAFPSVDGIFDAGSNYTMGVAIADWDNTGTWSMYISNMYSHAGNRIVPLVKGISPEMKDLATMLAQGNQFYEADASLKSWKEDAQERGVNWADWAWACLFFDIDNDGDRDIFVTNGFTSNADKNAPDY